MGPKPHSPRVQKQVPSTPEPQCYSWNGIFILFFVIIPRRATLIQKDCDAKLEDAFASQKRQASLVERLQKKIVEFRDKYESSNTRLIEVSQIANQAQIRYRDTNEVLRTLEDRIRITEVGVKD